MDLKKGILGIYARQSVEKETTGSIDDQILSGKEKAKELGLSFEIYIDRGESAAYDTLDNRPEFVRLLGDINSGKITSVFVYDESRLSRNRRTFDDIVSLFIRFKIIIYTKIEGVIDYQDSDQEFISALKNLFNVKLVRDTSKKIKGVLRNNARKGKAGGGVTLPYGYTKDSEGYLIIEPEERYHYLQMVEWSLGGYGAGRIASWLNEQGILTKGRKIYKNGLKIKNKYTKEITHIEQNQILWAPNTVLSILKNPIYKGERHFRGEIFTAPAIISAEHWEEIQKGIERNKIHSPRNNKKHLYLLKGLLRCTCGRNLYGYIKEAPGKTQHVYQCSSKRIKGGFCGMKSVNIERLDDLVWGLISDTEFFTKRIVAEFQRNDSAAQIKNIENQIGQAVKAVELLEERRKRRIDLFETKGIDRTEYDIREKEYFESKANWNRQIEGLRERASFLSQAKHKEERLIEFAKKVCAKISNLTKQQKIIVLKELVKNIIVGFDAENSRHSVQCLLNFEVIVNTPAELFLNPDGTSNYVGTKYNVNTFNDKFNTNNHILFEKYKEGGDKLAKELFDNQSINSGKFIATPQHRKWYGADF